MEIAAIPTTYKGIELKSRMEAQCAVCGSCGSKSLAWYLLNVEDGKLLLNGLPIEQVQF